MSNQVPERLINFRVYAEGNNLVGVVDAELPELEAMTDTITGAGIAGEIDTPTLGHFGSLGLSLNWRTVTRHTTQLAAQRGHQLDLRGSVQVTDAGTGTIRTQQVRLSVMATPKRTGLGSFEVAAAMGSSSEFEVTYLKLFIDGRPALELDKLNFKFIVDGIDYLESVRRDLGM